MWASWPQACIAPSVPEAKSRPVSSRSGSASMSARRTTVGPGRPPSMIAATELSATPRRPSSPIFPSSSTITSWVTGRSIPISGRRWIRRRIAVTSGAMARGGAEEVGEGGIGRRRHRPRIANPSVTVGTASMAGSAAVRARSVRSGAVGDDPEVLDEDGTLSDTLGGGTTGSPARAAGAITGDTTPADPFAPHRRDLPFGSPRPCAGLALRGRAPRVFVFCAGRRQPAEPSPERRRRDAAAASGLVLVGEVRGEPSLRLGDRHALAGGVVGQLVAADPAETEVGAGRVPEVVAGDRRARPHREGLGQPDPGP